MVPIKRGACFTSTMSLKNKMRTTSNSALCGVAKKSSCTCDVRHRWLRRLRRCYPPGIPRCGRDHPCVARTRASRMNRGIWMAGAGGGRAHRRPEIVVVGEGSEMLQMEFLKNKFDLTPAEARLVVRLITGESLRPCANALGIKYETVRTYLKSVFQKTKTRRQAELVMVVIRAMNETNPPPPRASPPARPGSSS